MILNNAPANEAIVSNVAEIGEFRIRNSAKAFSILSSGLYANKIRAVIRELSCNAVDSHAAAGKRDTPFDVHLPNTLEPHFSIRDYGTGLSHQQVTQIYTTYFESTKTASNEFIGALGLGSKSPFSYTDNFTVTAIKDGRKGIYSAFINGEGVPSIALMMQEDTDEPAGVEVKFSVNDRYDFDKFRQEARQVYTHFALRPVVSGCSEFQFVDTAYESRDIVPGVHSIKDGHRRSVAVMGNIAYPIDIPQADQNIGELRQLLGCGLELNFGIGELDFQASREGLSYIPETVAAIKSKLEALNAALTVVLAAEANAITNLWDRALFLNKKKEHQLWNAAATKYATDTALPTFIKDRHYWRSASFEFKVTDLAAKFNIVIHGVNKSRHAKTCSTLKARLQYGDKNVNGTYETWNTWTFDVDANSHFVVNDSKTGATERVRYHYKETPTKDNDYSRNIWILSKADKTKDMDVAGFFAAIHNPPEDRRFQASSLMQKERTSMGKNVTILSLQRRGGSGYRRSDEDHVWRDAGKADSFDDKVTFYYVPLSGFTMQSAKGYTSGTELYEDVKSLPGLFNGTIYGVRKTDIEDIKKRKNWVNFEDHISTVLTSKDNSKLLMSLVKSRLDNAEILQYTNNKEIIDLINADSPYSKLVSEFIKVDKFNGNTYNIDRLFRRFAPKANLSPDVLVIKYNAELKVVNSRYPLLSKTSTYRITASDIAEYINLIDAKKGI
jgi:hypothetical protein